MASKRRLKRDFMGLVSVLLDEALLLRWLSTEEDAKHWDGFITDIVDFTGDTMRRIQNPDKRKSPKETKVYYRQIRAEIDERISLFNDRITTLLEKA